METKIEIRIKMNDGNELVLSGNDARELYMELKKIYEKEREYIPYTYPIYTPPHISNLILGDTIGHQHLERY